ncbi:MAG: amino acid ABC transporter substrate-binding protein [Lachnospiraceae bacterium]|nr:amino acid ABC transporter substrate-binding protein [Lachnospiraceae bacterium]
MKRTHALPILLAAAILTVFAAGCAKSDNTEKDSSLTNIVNKRELILGFDDNFPPMGFVGEDGNYTGFDIDLAREVCSRLGVELKLQPIVWDRKEEYLNDGRIDCIWNGLSVNSERRESMNLSEPYMENETVFVVKKNSPFRKLSDLEGRRVGTQAGSSTESALESSKDLPELNIVKADDNYKLFDMMESDELDAVFIDSIVAYYYISENNKDYYILPSVLGNEDFAIGFRKNDQALRNVVQKTLHEMKEDGTLAGISIKWFGTDVTIVK